MGDGAHGSKRQGHFLAVSIELHLTDQERICENE